MTTYGFVKHKSSLKISEHFLALFWKKEIQVILRIMSGKATLFSSHFKKILLKLFLLKDSYHFHDLGCVSVYT